MDVAVPRQRTRTSRAPLTAASVAAGPTRIASGGVSQSCRSRSTSTPLEGSRANAAPETPPRYFATPYRVSWPSSAGAASRAVGRLVDRVAQHQSGRSGWGRVASQRRIRCRAVGEGA